MRVRSERLCLRILGLRIFRTATRDLTVRRASGLTVDFNGCLAYKSTIHGLAACTALDRR